MTLMTSKLLLSSKLLTMMPDSFQTTPTCLKDDEKQGLFVLVNLSAPFQRHGRIWYGFTIP